MTAKLTLIRELHAAGLRTAEIAERTELTVRTVQQRLSELGLKAHKSGTAGPRGLNLHVRISASEMDRIREASETAGLSMSDWVRAQLGLELGSSKTAPQT